MYAVRMVALLVNSWVLIRVDRYAAELELELLSFCYPCLQTLNIVHRQQSIDLLFYAHPAQ